MTLQQLHAIKLWHVAHKPECPIEYHAWDGVLTAWLFGFMGEPAALILSWRGMAIACVLLFLAPTFYVAARRSLHRRGVLRCDWLGTLSTRRD
ncbi:MAG: hypothetical protein KF891_19400 [Rhizobacter sp.]|nr:hypothetical protein [Rhizobacter sp.]